MGVSEVLAQIDQEIAQLHQARTLLVALAQPALKKSPGRPKKVSAKVQPAIRKAAKRKRNLSPEGRARIAEAARRSLGGSEEGYHRIVLGFPPPELLLRSRDCDQGRPPGLGGISSISEPICLIAFPTPWRKPRGPALG